MHVDQKLEGARRKILRIASVFFEPRLQQPGPHQIACDGRAARSANPSLQSSSHEEDTTWARALCIMAPMAFE